MRNGSISRARSSRATAIVLSVLAAASTSMAAACSTSSTPAIPGTVQAAPVHGPLERTTLKVGVVKNEIGALPVYTGVDQKLFEKQGVTVTVDDSFVDDAAAMTAMNLGKVDVVYGDYAHYFVAKSIGTVPSSLVAEGYEAGPGTVRLVGRSDIAQLDRDRLRDLVLSKGIVVPAISVDPAGQAGTYSVPELMLASAFAAISPAKFTRPAADALLHQKAWDSIGDLLNLKQADIAVMTEPAWSIATDRYALSSMLDLTAGANQNMPLGGYFDRRDFNLANLNLVAAFTAGLTAAKQATSDHAVAVGELVKHYKNMSQANATALTIGTFPLTVNTERLGRVVALLKDWGLAQFIQLETMVPVGSVGLPSPVKPGS